MSKFCGLRSRWRTLWLWQKANPRSSWYLSIHKLSVFEHLSSRVVYYMKDLTTSGSISPLRLSKYFFKSWSQCSKTSVSFLSLCKTSYSRTMFLCFSSFKRQISRKADEGTPWNKQLFWVLISMARKASYLIVVIQPDSFQSYNLMRLAILCFENRAVCTCMYRKIN